ncbi:ROK family transcriptional regulator [Rhizobium paknamense]|uniref:NBD/HSP70 family sugar kinase n=1 Tax=Rhizobium paknamense TaxID=1206817 RepID=A0ABU0IDL9_9HYPH|nr:ROK family transcriptional regulator [Rhizobium paknamense]MDQ0456344.1 putative NBD/HSP70 family sugar kinase [Rhizobium paknamense]
MSMPSAVRHINEKRVLDVVFRQGKVSRANIARELEITRSTASNLVAGLAEEGLLVEDTSEDDKSAGTGRPGTFVRLNPHHALFVGADIGVGRITVVALDFAGAVVSQQHFPLAPDQFDPQATLRQLSERVKEVVKPYQQEYGVKGLCVTVPGVIDKSGMVLRAPFLGWRSVPILEELTQLLPDMPVIVAENDANAFAFADHYRNGHPVEETEVYLFLDAGIGGAIISGGQLLRGHDGYAGELGHMILGERGFVEVATLPGSFESFIGRDAILARHRHHGGQADDIDAFLAKAAGPDEAAVSAMRDWAFYLGRGLAIISSIFNPTRIVLGGPVARLFSRCEEDVLRNTRQNLLSDHPVPAILLSRLGLEGPALGGASMLHRSLFSVQESLVFRKGQTRVFSGKGEAGFRSGNA